MDDKTRLQIQQQCLVVASLAESIAEVHRQKAALFEKCPAVVDGWDDLTGPKTAAYMEMFGDALNAMDACSGEDEWMEPVFLEVQKRWPATQAQGGQP